MTADERSNSSDETGGDRDGDGSGRRDGGHFGTFLKSQREARGISLAQVAARTNIQPEVLAHIETERLDQLPEPVYIKGFLKAYAQAVGADPREAVLRYERHDAAYRQALSARQLRGRRRLLGRMLLGALLVGGGIMAVNLFLLRGPGVAPEEAPREASTMAADPPAPTATEASSGEASPSKPAVKAGSTKAGAAAQQPLMLSAVGLKETTLKIIVDGKRPKVYHLKADTRLEIEAKREFNILMDDARAVTLYLNGEPVAVYGREGQQVTLQLP